MTRQELKPKKRIDLQVMEFLPNLTRSSIKKLIIEGIIKVNNEEKMPNYRPSNSDVITYDQKEINSFLNIKNELRIPEKKIDLEILFEDEDTLIIYKPVGLNVHPVTKKDTNSLLNGAYFFMNNESNFEKNVRLRLVNRIDKETSGIVVLSKNLEAHDFYSKQFEDHTVKKIYFAIVKGDFAQYLDEVGRNKVEIENFLSTSSNTENRYYSTSNQNGRYAKTIFVFDSHFNKFGKKKFSKLLIEIKTGRTHQIRVHLSELGFPILGDTLYGGQKYKRLMLHAYKIKLTNFSSKKEIETEAKIPEEFTA